MEPAKDGYIHTHMVIKPPTQAVQIRKPARLARSSFLKTVIS